MTTEQAVLLQLLKSEITGEKSVLPSHDIDWSKVAEESAEQAVILSAFESASRFKNIIPADVYQNWFKKALAVTASNSYVNKAQNNLVKLLEKNGYSYVILKGEAAAAYYNKPSNRALGDVDFLIDPADKEKIHNLLIDNGYISSHEHHACHVVYKKSKEHLEMHFEMSGMPYGKTGDAIKEFLSQSLENAVSKDIGTGEFKAPDDIYHAVILLVHTQHHMLSEGIGLRHLCDFACFLSKTAQKTFWEENLIPFLRSVGLYDFMSVLSDISVQFLGVPRPYWLKESDSELAKEIVEDILSGGNFGRKDELRHSGAVLIARKKDGKSHGKIYSLYRTLKSSTDELYPIAKKYPILYAVFFSYRIVLYIIRVITGKRISFIKAIPEMDKRKVLYDKLHIFEVEK